MTRARLGAALLIVLVVAAAAFAFARSPTRDSPQGRPTLLLLTSLPLVFGEDFSLESAGSPALKALQTRYKVVPISVTDGSELAKGKLLLMVHPSAQTAENLVTLDTWVKNGGRVLLLADPMLEWPSKRPLGDALRPSPMFMDTGLLQHWGLRLDAPDGRGPQARKLGGYDVLTVSPGSLSGNCPISADRLVAHCSIGKGRATIVADADLLDAAERDSNAAHNLDALVEELAALSSQ